MYLNLLLVSMMATASSLRYILGSGSSSRKLILKNMNISFEVMKPSVDEKGLGDRSSASFASELVLLLGHAKADNILAMLTEEQKKEFDVVITADQVVTSNGKILEKPESEEEARQFIRSYGSHSCSTVGSLVLTKVSTGERVSGVDVATIYLKPIPEEVIDGLIKEGEIFYCAGGLMIEHPAIQPYIDRLEGSMNSIMGLSSDLFQSLLPQLLKK